MGYYFNGCKVDNNTVKVTSGRAAYGMYCYGYSSGTFPWSFKNNDVIVRGGNSTVYGLYNYYCSNADIINNSIC
jgi:hypothetical protein